MEPHLRPINLNDMLKLDREGPSTLVRQLHGRLREMILRRTLKPGTELPSTRSLAADLMIGRNTVIAAYDHLVAEGRPPPFGDAAVERAGGQAIGDDCQRDARLSRAAAGFAMRAFRGSHRRRSPDDITSPLRNPLPGKGPGDAAKRRGESPSPRTDFVKNGPRHTGLARSPCPPFPCFSLFRRQISLF